MQDELMNFLNEDFMIEQFKELEKIRRNKNFKYKIYAILEFFEHCNSKNKEIGRSYSNTEIIGLKMKMRNKKLFCLAHGLYNYFFARYENPDNVKTFKAEKDLFDAYDK